MNAKNRTCIKALLIVGMGIMVAGSAMAERGPKGDKGGDRDDKRNGKEQCEGKRGSKGCPWATERKEFRQSQHEKIKAFMEKRREKMKSSRESAKKEEDPQKIITMIKANHARSAAEAKEFFGGIQKANEEFMASMFKKYDVPEDKQAKIKEHAVSKREKMKKMHEERYKKMTEALDKLAEKDDLTKEDIKNVMHKMRGSKHGRRDKDGKCRHQRRRKGGKGQKGDRGNEASGCGKRQCKRGNDSE